MEEHVSPTRSAGTGSTRQSAPVAVHIPGPAGHPIWGSMPEFNRDRLAFLVRMAQEYGDMVHYRFAHQKLFQVNHPEGVQRILQDNQPNYYKGASFDIFRDLMGNGLFTSEGRFWLRQRRMMQPAFHRKQVATFGELMVAAAGRMLERWEAERANGQSVYVFNEMARLAMEIATESLMGVRVSDEQHQLGQALYDVLDEVALRFRQPVYPPLWVPTPRNRRHVRQLALLHSTVQAIIDERRSVQADKNDLLAMMMEAVDEDTGQKMSDKQLQDEVMILFIAGHETSATTLSWVLILLAQHPEIEQRLHAEVDAVLGGRLPTMNDLAQLPYTYNVIQETMRLYPPAWMTMRTSVEADEMLGFPVPGDALFIVSPYVNHHDPRWWEQPETFDPDRFRPERSEGRPKYAYFPFGGGPHKCIGNSFALAEIQLVLATLVQRYCLRLQPEDLARKHITTQLTTTLRPSDRLQMEVVRR